MHVYTDDELECPVFKSEFVDFAKLDEDDPMIFNSLMLATSSVVSFLKLDLMTRTWTLIHRDWPVVGTVKYPSLTPQNAKLKLRIDLPYTNLISVESVLVSGEESTSWRVVEGKPCAIEFDEFAYKDYDEDALKVTYKAGFGDSSADVPKAIRNAIMLAASYIHAHAGACDYTDAITNSGAKQLLTPYAVTAGIVI